MRNQIIFGLAAAGVLSAAIVAVRSEVETKPLAPAFSPASNPYGKGIYASCIIESQQANGANLNVYPEVAGTIARIHVAEGDSVACGATLVTLDDSVQRATAEQQRAQAAAALAQLEALRAQPRKETLEITLAQLEYARATLKTAEDQLEKQRRSYEIEPRSVSRDALDNAVNTAAAARASVRVAEKQLALTRAGAWIYDIRNQQSQYAALQQTLSASEAQLRKYTIRAPSAGVVMAINAAEGSYVSPQGTYDTYGQGFVPLLVMGSPQDQGGVRCYVDEILVHRLPAGKQIQATMFVRGTQVKVPLQFVRIQPYVSPKIELSNQRQERVDVRVLPVIFRFDRPKDFPLYPGQLVDVYIAEG